MTATATATKIPSQTDTAMVRRLLSIYRSASAETTELGAAWYATAQSAAAMISPEDPQRGAYVIAALSPRCQWKVNLAWAAVMMDAARNGRECPRVHNTTMRGIAWNIATGGELFLNGPKVSRFARNILGDMDAVTVDVWAARAAEGYRNPTGPSGKRYARIERAYQRAAAIAGIAPASLQAVVWIQVRGSAV